MIRRYVFILLLFMCQTEGVLAAAGDLDVTFGDGGWNSASPMKPYYAPLYMKDVVMQPDGKLLAGADFCPNNQCDSMLLRYNVNGSLDKSFGDNGKLVESFDYLGVGVSAIALQEDGKFVVVSKRNDAMVISRYLSNGSLDASFGDSGRSVLPAPSFNPALEFSWTASIAVQADGKIVLGLEVLPHDSEIVLARLNADGVLDDNFAEQGWLQTGLSSGLYSKLHVLLQADQKLVVAATAPDRQFVLHRYLANGEIDSEFGNAGEIMSAAGSPASHYWSPQINGLLQQKDGKLLVVGVACNGRSSGSYCDEDMVLIRFDQQGLLDDDSFGIGGIAWSQLKEKSDFGYSVFENDNGSLDVAGVIYNDSGSEIVFARYQPDGALDKSFGNKGIAISGMPESADGDIRFARATGKDTAVIYNCDHKKYYFGYIEQQRISPSGNKRAGFGNIKTKRPTQSASAEAVFSDSDGAFYLAGFVQKQMTYSALVAKFDQNGQLDRSYGNKGFWRSSKGRQVLGRQRDGKWLMSGATNNGEVNIYRYTAARKLDRRFGKAGKVVIPKRVADGYQIYPMKLLQQPDGKLLFVMSQNLSGGGRNFYLTRYLPNGSLDTAFADQGYLLLADYYAYPTVFHVDIQGKILLGFVDYLAGRQGHLLRFNADGSADAVFGDAAARSAVLQENRAVVLAVIESSDGSILFLANGDEPGFIIGKLDTDGNLVTAFADNGIALVAEPAEDMFSPRSLHQLANGQLLVDGSNLSTSQYQSVNFVRLSAGGVLDTTFGDGGLTTFRASTDGVAPMNTQGTADMTILPNGDWLVPFRLDDNKMHAARFHGAD